jgi:hypothetical protein
LFREHKYRALVIVIRGADGDSGGVVRNFDTLSKLVTAVDACADDSLGE